MPNNLGYTPGTGATLATRDVGGVHYPAGTLFDAAGNEIASATTTPGASDRGLVVRAAGTVTTSEAQAPTYFWDSGDSALAASKIHLLIYNPAGSGYVARLRLVVIKPGQAAVTGVLSSAFLLQRRVLTNVPVGAFAFPGAADSVDQNVGGGSAVNLLTTITTAPTGTARTIASLLPQPDEIKLSTLDAPTMASLFDWGGTVLYRHHGLSGTKPVTIRAGESAEVVQGSTAGTGNVRVFIAYTVETS